MKKDYNKIIILSFFSLLTFILFIPNVLAANLDYSSICSNESIKQAMKMLGYFIQVIRWIVPLIIIILGMIDFGKVVLSNDEKAINKATGALIRRFVAGIVVFLIPTIILAILNAIEVTKGIEKESDTNFGACTKCLFDPYNDCPIP